ncbi:MAG: hypothetical protein OMM_06904 [Candidatus Magnetoglobus multicellularis str. Araruama]|uniref:DUF4351 domain-containing protein n=1 Tax=Candidatus Magnetoglobus multicellularis str. Araruama TaxID=890399 RepID=A0A1V1PF95_9BACT|nr:MAG: hypothetical protein OMM_06904 [Candidatus Magnetoglobus multicellularis str. Araruama]
MGVNGKKQFLQSMTTEIHDAINVMSLFILNRFRTIDREDIKAMLDFDILDTVAGRQVYDEGMEKGMEKGREENMREMLVFTLNQRFGNVSSDIVNAIYAIKDFDYLKSLFAASFSYNNFDHFRQYLSTADA